MNASRRDFLKTSAAAFAAAGVAKAAPSPQSDLIKRENARPGTRDWQLTRVRPNGYNTPAIEGYCSRQSVKAGESIDVMVSTNPASRFTLEIFRMGYYGGRGARLMTSLGPLKGKPQSKPPIGKKRLRHCQWEPATTIKIPSAWPSGVYLGRLTAVPENRNKP